jgi:hypothetical protein
MRALSILQALCVLAGFGFPNPGLAQVTPAAPASAPPILNRSISQVEARQALAELELYRTNYSQAVATAQSASAERDQAKAETQKAIQTLEACRSQNVAMAKVATDVLEAYSSIRLSDVLQAREPFLGLKRVELENAVQEKSDQVYAARCGVPAAAAAAN